MIVKTGANYQAEGGYIEASRSGSTYSVGDGEIETTIVGADNSTQKAYAARSITILNDTDSWISFPSIINGVLQYGSETSIDAHTEKTIETLLSKDTAIQMSGSGSSFTQYIASDPAIRITQIGSSLSFIVELIGELTGDVITITRG